MTMKSLYIVYITSCFLWTMSDNKAYLILSYLMQIKEKEKKMALFDSPQDKPQDICHTILLHTPTSHLKPTKCPCPMYLDL